MGSININGRSYTGSNITVVNDQVIIDGKSVDYDKTQTEIHVIVHGNVNKLKCNTVEITGDVLGNVNANTVKCEVIGGNVDSNTVHADYINGKVDANTVKVKNKIKK